jgi:hypothetical protein
MSVTLSSAPHYSSALRARVHVPARAADRFWPALAFI